VSDEAPLIVLVVGVIVTVPAPVFCTMKANPAPKLPVACGRVTAIALALLKVMSLQVSVEATVYEVPVCALIGALIESVPPESKRQLPSVAPLTAVPVAA